MKNIDHKIFVPRGENNYVMFNAGTEFEITEWVSINIFVLDDKVMYWFYIKIPHNDLHHKSLLQRGKKPKLILLIGNNPYRIIGKAEVIETSYHNWEEMIQIFLCFTVLQASNTINNPRKIIKLERTEIIDIREN